MEANHSFHERQGEGHQQKESKDSNQQENGGGNGNLKLKNFEIVPSETEDEEDLSDFHIRVGIFTCFWASGLFGNLDTGVIPTTLHLIEKDLGIS